MQLSIVIPIIDKEDDITGLVSRLRGGIPAEIEEYEIIVVDGRSGNSVTPAAAALDAEVVSQPEPGYAAALKAGFERAGGEYVLTVDADLFHSADFISTMWRASREAEVVIASRYIQGGNGEMPWLRRFSSRVLNRVFKRVLSLPVHDLTSGIRLYRAALVRSLSLQSTHFDVLEEILIKVNAEGRQIVEVPFKYRSTRNCRICDKVLRVGWGYFRTMLKMWRLRNSIDSADYDYRAFDSSIPLQRYWQRTRHQIVLDFAQGAGKILDIGCGSSRILLDLQDAIGMDVQIGKIRYLQGHGARGLVGSAFALPFPDRSFDCIVNSQVIEHLPEDPQLFKEMARLVKPGGCLIIGTPDYGGFLWPLIEFLYARLAPGGYADEHITHYTRRSLVDTLHLHGFEFQAIGWVGRAEMIIKCVKPLE